MARTRMGYTDRTDFWLNHPWRPSRVITVPKGVDTYTLPSYYDINVPVTDPSYSSIPVRVDRKFKVIRLDYVFTEPEYEDDTEYVLLVRAEALG